MSGVSRPDGAPLLTLWHDFFRVRRDPGTIAKGDSADHCYGLPTSRPSVVEFVNTAAFTVRSPRAATKDVQKRSLHVFGKGLCRSTTVTWVPVLLGAL